MSIHGNKGAVLAALPLAIALGLSACGGGGSNVREAPPPVEPPPPPPPTGTGNANPAYSKHLLLTRADQAIEAGYTGAGVTIGIVDTGVNRNHPALAGRVRANFVHVGEGNDLTVDDKVGHGTIVAQLAAGKPFGEWPGGIAQDAWIVSSRIISDAPPDDDGSGEGNEVTAGQGYGEFFRAINTELANAGAMILNNSWGGLYWDDPAVTVEFADAYRDFIINRGGLVVFANGNAGADPDLRSNPSDNAALPSKDPYAADLEVGWLAVGALDTDHPDQLADYSQACGVAMNYCLVAPGDVVFTGVDDIASNPTYWKGSGTSFAAPLVSGAAAVVWSAFPYFDNDLVRQTLLGTATDLGAAGVDPEFGYGRLNVGAAIRGPGRFDWGDVTVDFDAITSTWSNDISGEGGLVKRGTGELVLASDMSYTGDTHVDGGTLRLDGNVTLATEMFIGRQGLLAGYGSMAGLWNDGTVLIDHLINVKGDYHQSAEGILAMILGNEFLVEGTAYLDGELQVVGVLPEYVDATRIGVLGASQLSGTFASLTSGPGVFLDGTLDYTDTHVFLDVERLDVSEAAQAMGLSAASLSGAGLVETAFTALDGGVRANAGAAFLRAAGALQQTRDAAGAERSLASLSGEMHASDASLALMAADDSRRQLERRLDAGTRGGAWASRLDGRRSYGGINASVRGWMLGQEFRAGDTTWGASLSRGEGTLWHGERFDRGRDLQTEGQLYAFHELRAGAYLMGRAAFGRLQRNLQREIVLGARDYGVEARYVDRYLSASVQAGWQLPAFGGTLVPYGGAQLLRLRRGGFAEAGAAGFGLDAERSTLDLRQSLLGARYGNQWRVGAAVLDVHGRVEWQRTLAHHGAIQASFTGLDARAPLALDSIGRDTALLGAGVGATWGNTRLSLELDARRTDGQSDLGAFANWSVAF